MKRLTLFLLSLLLLADVSFAQNSMLAGKLVGEDNMPIAGAKIEMKRGYKVAETKSDDDGLFYSKLLPVGYYHIRVVAGGKYMRAKTVYLPDETKKKSYFYLRVVGDKVIVVVDAEDPFLKAKLTKLEKEDQRKVILEGAGAYFIVKIDSATGKEKTVIGPPTYPPRMKDVH
jgi:hypothetical protein